MAYKVNGFITSKIMGDATILALDIEYSTPSRVLGKPVEKVIMERNRQEADLGLMNIKKRLERRNIRPDSYSSLVSILLIIET